MTEIRAELAEVCRDHAIAPEILEGARDDDQLLDRVLEACEQQTDEVDAGTAEGILRMQGLIRLARRLREPHAEASDLHRDAERLNQLFAELSRLCHKINNPLTSVLGRAQIMQLKMKNDPDLAMAKPVQVIEQSAKRVAVLVQELGNLVGTGRRLVCSDHEPSSSTDER